MAKNVKAHGGGRLGRSETVTIRLDPKLNYLAEIAARAQRRTKSSLVEAALAEALYVVRIDAASVSPGRTVAQIGEELWHVDEWVRLQRLALHAPHLMTFEEQKVWAVIEKNSIFWFGEWRDFGGDAEFYAYDPSPKNLLLYTVEQHWELLKKVAAGEATPDQLPKIFPWRAKAGLGHPPGALGALTDINR